MVATEIFSFSVFDDYYGLIDFFFILSFLFKKNQSNL